MRYLLLFLLLWQDFAFAQGDPPPVPNSTNGWYLSPRGTIRILVLFAEIDYDVNPNKDPQPNGSNNWPKGGLPQWKDELFDPMPSPRPKATVTRYYHDVSLGNYTVLGDYVDRIITLKESEYPGLSNWSASAVAGANKLGKFRTAHGLSVADFDLWKEGGKPGLVKEPGPDSPHSYDHVMTILRNSGLTHGQGSTDSGSSGKLYGFDCDTQSRFGGMNDLPFEILKHEFNHLLLGGNNFHSGGGNASSFQSYFICLQGGWSLMGAASSSLLTCSGWDRDRLGWMPDGTMLSIRMRDEKDREMNGDIDPQRGDTGLFVLRDFVTTGDAMRIKLPFLPEDEFPQWIWVENHQTFARNGSPTDRFHWESTGIACVEQAPPGLYMQLQVDRGKREGTDIYGGYADYLHPLPASGNYDLELTTDTVRNKCPFGGETVAYVQLKDMQNPLTGNCEQELPVHDRDGNQKVERKEHVVPNAIVRTDGLHNSAIFFGRKAHAFTMAGSRKLGMGTNPSSSNVLTLVSSGTNDSFKGDKPNNRVVYLNGISVEMEEQRPDGSILVRVRNNDTFIDRDLRWCGDSIVLPDIKGRTGSALHLAKGCEIRIDRSRTPTRIDHPEVAQGRTWYSDPTRFTVADSAHVRLDSKARISLENGTELHMMPGSSMTFGPSAKLVVDATSRVILHGDARLDMSPTLIKKLAGKGRLQTVAPHAGAIPSKSSSGKGSP